MADHMTAEQLRAEMVALADQLFLIPLPDDDVNAERVEAVSGRLRALAARLSGMAADTWQPIETAPKDGTKILVFTAIGDIEIGQWCTTEWDRYELHDADRNLYTRRVDIHEFWNNNFPTHWMPLPAAPEPPHV